MKIGLIAEFNPFHNGHKYLINKIKEKYPNSQLIVALSSDYVQRGEIAIASYEERKEMALKNGVDFVVPLDFETSTQAAHIFAKGAIETLLKEGIDLLCFGVSDTSDVDKYINAANRIKNNLDIYNLNVKKYLKQGNSFVKSTFLSLNELMTEDEIPADILGFEYTKYIIDNNINVKLDCFKRTVAHNSEDPDSIYASGSYIRKLVKEGKNISQYTSMKIDKNYPKIEDRYSEFQTIVLNLSSKELSEIKMVSEGMENLFKKNIDASSYDEFVERCTSKRYTSSRIKRVILYILMNIKKSHDNNL
ncbi:cytidyltransferase-like domain [Metamycoplasma cloacale]|uniref:tRNA(Met) cytidine acetate ligase n=1 Tax=Metamycoplasma cloacale TaxID=92401 RepID=A0A2Z4LLG7_9BACT|nr:nucleotidyltransferase [Metamycoplasma cloacale]AWX42535.1 hypothetical protein DK849_00325 [Metamycoplasma cloacale]VEU79119.1 cytidyltransferase-like domain [Metamycoplasma cloacale]VEU79802.1 cytidyltransferase-like domain [Metamycoplasma cloacale]